MPKGFPLAVAREGESVRVTSVRGNDAMQKHLQSLGFVPGAEVQLVTQSGGQVIVLVKGARLGLNRETSRNVFVEE